MRRIDGIIGNRHDDPDLDEAIHAHERDGTLERVVLDLGERKKSRLRLETDAGTDLGILVHKPELQAGDVLFIDDDQAAILSFRRRDAYAVELPQPSDEAMCLAVELGHRIGNQHWDLAIQDRTLYVPVEVDEHIIEDVLHEYIPSGAPTRYEEVDASLFLDDPDDPATEHEHSHAQDIGPHSHSHNTGYD